MIASCRFPWLKTFSPREHMNLIEFVFNLSLASPSEPGPPSVRSPFVAQALAYQWGLSAFTAKLHGMWVLLLSH